MGSLIVSIFQPEALSIRNRRTAVLRAAFKFRRSRRPDPFLGFPRSHFKAVLWCSDVARCVVSALPKQGDGKLTDPRKAYSASERATGRPRWEIEL